MCLNRGRGGEMLLPKPKKWPHLIKQIGERVCGKTGTGRRVKRIQGRGKGVW